MKTDQLSEPTSVVFLQTVSVAVTQLKQQLQQDYEQAYPELREIIHLVLDEEEANAWRLTRFPHLLLPDLVEAHIAKLNLKRAETKHEDVFARHGFAYYQPALASYLERGSEKSRGCAIAAMANLPNANPV